MLETKILPDFIVIDGAEGGTGAAPVEFSNRLGMVCLAGVSFVNSALIGVGLRDDIKIIASGKTATCFDLLSKIATGADIVNAARTMMFAIDCIQSKHCNTNLCPTGIATQDPARAKAINVSIKSGRVMNYHNNTIASFFELVGSMGLDSPLKILPQMIKRRSPYGVQMSTGSLIEPLKHQDLLADTIDNTYWKNWWESASAEQFYVNDIFILAPPELRNK